MGEAEVPDEPELADLARIAGEAGPDIQVVVDPSATIRFASRSAQRLLGRVPRNSGRAHLLHFVHPNDGARILATMDMVSSRQGRHRPIPIRVRDAVGHWADCEATAQAVAGPGGTWAVLSVREVGERDPLAARTADLQRLVDSASVEFAITRWNDVGEVTHNVLRSLCSVFGARLAEIAWAEADDEALVVGAGWSVRASEGSGDEELGAPGATFEPICLDVDRARRGAAICEDLSLRSGSASAKRFAEAGLDSAVELRLSMGQPCAVLRLGFAEGLGAWDAINTEPTALIGRIALSSLRRCRTEEELHERARRDSLTGLFNRDELYRLLEGAIASACQVGLLGVLYCDVDGFKATNDDLGHARGDQVLRAVADEFRQVVREGDTVARVGGDEFVALCPDLECPEQLESIAERLGERVSDLRVEGRTVSLSVGCAVLGDGQGADQLIGAADAAMYRAKRGRFSRRRGDRPASGDRPAPVAGEA